MTNMQWLLVAVGLIGAGVILAGALAAKRAGRARADSGPWYVVALLGLLGTVVVLVLLITGADG